jgi:hypothetical protein
MRSINYARITLGRWYFASLIKAFGDLQGKALPLHSGKREGEIMRRGPAFRDATTNSGDLMLPGLICLNKHYLFIYYTKYGFPAKLERKRVLFFATHLAY